MVFFLFSLNEKLFHFNFLLPKTKTCAERLRASGGSSQSERNKDSNPFTHSSHGNPAFTPQKVSKGSNLVSKRIEEWLIPNGLKPIHSLKLNAKNVYSYLSVCVLCLFRCFI